MQAASTKGRQSIFRSLLFLFITTVIVLLLGVLCSLKWGTAHVAWSTLYEALLFQGNDKPHLYIQTLRLPRTLTASMAGAMLAVAGLLTQLSTKNPLASPHIFGINAGAVLAVVLGLVISDNVTPTGAIYIAFIGAGMGGLLIWTLAGRSNKQYVMLALAGITVHFLLSALTEGLILLDQQSTDSIMFWMVGSVSQAGWSQVRQLLPVFLSGMLLVLLLVPSLRLLLLDDEVASSLGQRVHLARATAMLMVILLAGAAVAVCGPISFVCLIVPHIARALAGGKLPVLVPLTALLGASLLVYADLIGRFIAYPYESPVGIVTAVIGAPFFIYLAQKRKGVQQG